MQDVSWSATISLVSRSYSERFARLTERDKRRIAGLDLHSMNRLLIPLFLCSIFLNMLDVISTLYAMSFAPSFFELNSLASGLFNNGPIGFLAATALLKIVPTLVLLFVILLKDSPSGRHAYEIRIIKLATIVALVFGNIFYGYVVFVHNIPILVGFVLS